MENSSLKATLADMAHGAGEQPIDAREVAQEVVSERRFNRNVAWIVGGLLGGALVGAIGYWVRNRVQPALQEE